MWSHGPLQNTQRPVFFCRALLGCLYPKNLDNCPLLITLYLFSISFTYLCRIICLKFIFNYKSNTCLWQSSKKRNIKSLFLPPYPNFPSRDNHCFRYILLEIFHAYICIESILCINIITLLYLFSVTML